MNKSLRQRAVLDVLKHGSVASQEDLQRALQKRGIRVGQATLSRDIRELGLVKGGADGAYQTAVAPVAHAAPGAHAMLQRSLAAQLLRLDRVQQLVLLRTVLGHAQSLCATLDSARLPEVVGTLAGEDTILIITADARRARALVKRLEQLAGERIAS